MFALTHPTATLARGIESLVLTGRDSGDFFVHSVCSICSRTISTTVFPLFLLIELTFQRLPQLAFSLTNPDRFNKILDKTTKVALSILFSPLGLYSPEGISSFFLKTPPSPAVRPFGVETQYGKEVDQISFPRSAEELRAIVRKAKDEGKQISVIGAGMSQGTQTVPLDGHQVVVNLKYLNSIRIEENVAHVGAGVNWEDLQIALNAKGKSTIVKQASDPFSVGGSIAMNCHGWAHEVGAIASTIEELEVIDATGNLIALKPEDELFRCMIGTLGYFGIIVSAKLRVVDNVPLIKKTEEVDREDFVSTYQSHIRGHDIPLFGGRLGLETLDGPPLRKVCMVRYEKDLHPPSVLRPFTPEPKEGTRLDRIGLQLASHLSNFSFKHLLKWFWEHERTQMFKDEHLTRNEALHPPINAFKMMHHSRLYTQWLQEYFIKPENLPNFLDFLGATLKANSVRLINATIRPVPKDSVSILPYAEQDRYAVVLCFAQEKTEGAMNQTRKWIETVTQYLVRGGDVFFQAYMPFATRAQFEQAYGSDRVAKLRELKKKYDPTHLFGNTHTAQYFDEMPA